MQIEWQIGPLSEWQADAIVFFAFEKAPEHLPGFRRWMEEQGSWLLHSAALGDIQGKPQQTAVLYAPKDQKIARIICAGLGPADQFDMEKLRSAAAAALRKCRELRVSRLALPLSAFEGIPVEPAKAIEETLIGGLAGLYRFTALKTKDVEPETFPETLLLLSEAPPEQGMLSAHESAGAIVGGITTARDLVVAPANQVTPTFIAEVAQGLAANHGFSMHLVSLQDAQSMGMGAFVAVAKGSLEPACIIILEHCPPGTEEDAPLVFVGKGITFDTGGISLKPSAKLEAMKQDMAGAASVLGALDVMGRLKVNRRVVGILPCTENMPDGKAYKPGDVIHSLAGLTVEVISTDAEGRMILCDALTFALRFKPAVMVDVATLTGACIVALGNEVAGIMGNREKLVEELRAMGTELGERLWPLPLWDFYFDYIKSDIADFKNVGDRSAGAIVGGIFLKQFVPDEIPWVHIDIAGTAWTDKDTGTAPKGATGFGVRILFELARRWPEMRIQ